MVILTESIKAIWHFLQAQSFAKGHCLGPKWNATISFVCCLIHSTCVMPAVRFFFSSWMCHPRELISSFIARTCSQRFCLCSNHVPSKKNDKCSVQKFSGKCFLQDLTSAWSIPDCFMMSVAEAFSSSVLSVKTLLVIKHIGLSASLFGRLLTVTS